MKTITLTDEAYERLRSWKRGPKDSFSSVVLNVVPKKGTLGQLLSDVRRLPPLNRSHRRIIRKIEEDPSAREDLTRKWAL